MILENNDTTLECDVLGLAERLFLSSYALGRDQRHAARAAIMAAAEFADEWNVLVSQKPEPRAKKRGASK